MKRSILIFLLIFVIFQLKANNIIDSLEISLESAKGTERILIFNHLSEEYRNISPQQSIDYGKLAFESAKKSTELILKCEALNNIGVGYYYLGSYNLAIENFTNALEIFNDLEDKPGIAKSYNNLGIVYRKLGKYDLALEYNFKSLNIEESLDNKKGFAESTCNIGNIYFEMSNYSKALDHYQDCLIIYEDLNDTEGLADILNNIGIVYDEEGKYDIALDYYLNSLEFEKQLSNKTGIATTSNNIGISYYNIGLYDKALDYLNRSLMLTLEIGEKYGIANSYLNIGKLHLAIEDYTNAINLLNKGLYVSSQIEARDLLMAIYRVLSEVYSKMNNFSEALDNYKLYVSHSESLLENNQDDLLDFQTQFELQKKEREFDDLFNKNKIYLIVIQILVVIIFLIIAFIILTNNRFRSRYIREQEEINNQLRELAQTDPLTNLANRRGMLKKIQHEKYRFERNNRSFSIIMCDIDGFKNVNDKFGHDVGDFVLSSISNLFLSMLRKQDMVGRWGGEEFIMLLPETDLMSGKELAEKMRKKIEENVFYYKGNNIWITVTLGVASFNKIEDIQETIQKADEALYEGKSQGKNCVV